MRHVPLGARVDHNGASFSVFSAHAEHVELCIFEDGNRERTIAMQRDGDEWRASVPGVGFGTRYGFRAHGPFDPASGHRFNPSKLLIDPYARAFSGKIDYRGPVFGSVFDKEKIETLDLRDSAAFVPKSVLVDTSFDWQNDVSPKTAWNDTVIYELHVKGFTKRHPSVVPEEQGTYLGLASEAAISHLRGLGVTAIELLPIHECLTEANVAKRGMTNYWGYSTLGFFAPDQRFATKSGQTDSHEGVPRDSRGHQVREFKEMVRRLHAAGIEVILDVVFNHTCEGDLLGPTVSFRGLDNHAYYKLNSENPAKYEDFTGCGNTFDASHPYGVRLICDALRYWIEEMHVDGFRFDLAPTLGRGAVKFDPGAPLFHAMFQDPIIPRSKLIAEPWDVTHEPMQLGKFPPPWREWNADFRDDIRRFWNGRTPTVGNLATRLAGSSDLFAGRGPLASINFITAHDGFTLRDLVSYSEKHNESNGEANRDGNDTNDSTNFGVEGDAPNTNAGSLIAAARIRQIRNFLFTLILAPGVPMITAGDEMFRTQRGNNNAYVKDDDTSWVDWDLGAEARELLEFSRALIKLRKNQYFSRHAHFFRGGEIGASKDLTWFRPDGKEMAGDDWSAPTIALGAWFCSPEEEVILLANASALDLVFSFPALFVKNNHQLLPLVDTRSTRIPFADAAIATDRPYALAARSHVLLRVPK